MKKNMFFVCIATCAFMFYSCTKDVNGENAGVVNVGNINIAGSWVYVETQEDRDEVGWYITITSKDLSYYEAYDDYRELPWPYFKDGYIYSQGHRWVLELYSSSPVWKNNTLFAEGFRMGKFQAIDKNTIKVVEEAWLPAGRYERVNGIK